MATYLKRTSKLFDLSLLRTTAEVHLRDLMCPICRGILIEPVTLPCTHNLCLRCLKGTFEHNSLSCPLCRIRVGSWLRTATKSETLVNHGLWELIRAKFPKEVADKHNGQEQDLSLDADFATKRILSAAGEIHREYEAQLERAEEEMRRQRQAEHIANEALIHKIQAEEQQQLLAQLAQDQLLAKTLAKKQVMEKEKQKETAKSYSECLNTTVPSYAFDTSSFNVKTINIKNNAETPQTEITYLESSKTSLPNVKDSSELRRTNMSLLAKIRAKTYSNVKTNPSSVYKDSSINYCCQKQIPVYNAVTKTLKHQAISKLTQPCTSNYAMKSGCSTSKTYAAETKEELRVPSDVVNNKKKSLGIEVCMTLTDDDERIGSAESSGSHDSINQEIHHFKPIKAMPRTPLKLSSDGKHVDPKLIRVIPILKRMSNAVPKAPSPTHLKRIIGCSWSAFKGKIRQDTKERLISHDSGETTISTNQKPSTSLDYSQALSNKLVKLQVNDTSRRLDFIPESSFDSNKNYTKHANKIINGTKVSKKLSLDDETEIKIHKSWKMHVKNGMIMKPKRQRNAWRSKKKTALTLDMKNENDEDSVGSSLSCDKTSPQNDQQDNKDDIAVENIAERIKRRKTNMENKASKSILETESHTKKTTRKRALPESTDGYSLTNQALPSSQKNEKFDCKLAPRAKRHRTCKVSQNNTENSQRSDLSVETDNKLILSEPKKSVRNSNLTKSSSKGNELDSMRDKPNSKCNYGSLDSYDQSEECISENNNANNTGSCVSKYNPSDEDVIKEQQRIERLLLQEKEDFELASRLQAKFDEMERIAGRTRRSRRAIESANIEADLCEIDMARTVRKMSGAHTAKRPIVNQTVSTETKKRGRPPKRVK